MSSFSNLFVLEPGRPTVDRRRSLFQPVENKQRYSDQEKREVMYNSFKDVLPQSSFVMFNDAEHRDEPLRQLSSTEGTSSTILNDQEVNVCENITFETMRPLSATKGNSNAILSEQEIDVCEIVTVEPLRPLSATRDTSNAIFSEQEINDTEAQATGKSLRPPFAMEGTSRAMLSKQEIDDIETATVGQSQNEAWQTYRKGRITASNFYRVFTKVETMKKSHKIKCLETAQKLVDSLLGHNAPPKNMPALKYGREMEEVAKQKYLKWFEKNHRDTTYRECGLFIDDTKQYLGATPDLIVECSCCGKGVVEFKCPYSIVNESPTPENLSYLIHSSGQVTLKNNHQYFAQVQGQMAITKRKWCHFLVYTQRGMHLETIHFDADYWKKIEENLTLFYVNHLAPVLPNSL